MINKKKTNWMKCCCCAVCHALGGGGEVKTGGVVSVLYSRNVSQSRRGLGEGDGEVGR